MVALSDLVEAVAGSNHPGIGRWPMQSFAEILKDGRMFGRHRSKVVEGFIHASSKAGSSNVVAENTAVYHLRKKRSLGYEFFDKTRNIPLPIRRKSFPVACTPAEGHDHGLLSARDRLRSERTESHKAGTQTGRPRQT